MILRNSILWLFVLMACATSGYAQGTTASQQSEALRAQLRDVQAKEAELQTRLQQIDEDLKPENIDHSISLIGTTHPETLRDERRRQLENERRSVQSQLDQLAESRTRLERTIAAIDAESYRQGAQVDNTYQQGSTTHTSNSTRGNTTSVKRRQHVRRRRSRRHSY